VKMRPSLLSAAPSGTVWQVGKGKQRTEELEPERQKKGLRKSWKWQLSTPGWRECRETAWVCGWVEGGIGARHVLEVPMLSRVAAGRRKAGARSANQKGKAWLQPRQALVISKALEFGSRLHPQECAFIFLKGTMLWFQCLTAQ
jgi:hypothetical protein